MAIRGIKLCSIRNYKKGVDSFSNTGQVPYGTNGEEFLKHESFQLAVSVIGTIVNVNSDFLRPIEVGDPVKLR